MPFQYDDSDWPTLLITASGDSSDEDLKAYLYVLTQKLKRRERHVVIVDATEGKSLKSTHRKRIADWNRDNAPLLRRYRAGLVIVSDNAVLRGLITAIYWLFPAPFPYKTVNRRVEAHLWASSQLRRSQ